MTLSAVFAAPALGARVPSDATVGAVDVTISGSDLVLCTDDLRRCTPEGPWVPDGGRWLCPVRGLTDAPVVMAALDGPASARTLALGAHLAAVGRAFAAAEVRVAPAGAWPGFGLVIRAASEAVDGTRRALRDAFAGDARAQHPACDALFARLSEVPCPAPNGPARGPGPAREVPRGASEDAAATRDAGTDVQAAARFDAVARWACAADLRRQAGARVVVQVVPPEEHSFWQVIPALVDAAMPSSALRLPADDGLLALFGAPVDTVRALAAAEVARAGDVLDRSRSLTPGTSEASLSHEARWSPKDVIEVLAASGALRAEGIELMAPPSLLRAASLECHLGVSGTPSGLFSRDLRVSADVLVVGADGVAAPVSPAELAALCASRTPLVQVGGRWVRLSPMDAERAAALVARVEGPASPVEVMALDAELNGDQGGERGDEQDNEDAGAVDAHLDSATLDGWLGDVLNGRWARPEAMTPAAGFSATLRDYQQEGLGWVAWVEGHGLGGVLADDMGLGKSVMTLARIHDDHSGPTLLVCPTGVISHWVREAARFAPELRVQVFHGPGRGNPVARAKAADVVVTSFGMLQRDARLADVQWHRVVIDEAQYIKNPQTAVARAARALPATHRLALTGTPVENHLGDLWSIMAFANPGLLGSHEAFANAFVRQEPSAAQVAALGRLLAPVMLRRTKRDPGIADDLPDQCEVVETCGLTAEQIGLYEATAQDLLERVDALTGQARRANVLAAITHLKQICVSPSLLTEPAHLAGRSGKVERLVALLQETIAAGEASLVFSQFASWLPYLAEHLASRLDRPVLWFSGASTRTRRQKVLDEFANPAGPPVLLASVKAGGVGLNVVRANHVVHLDHWWNPATQDQASDRPWRIGQDKTVYVHQLRCPGTLEDGIATMLADKRALASALHQGRSYGDWDTEALRELITLSTSGTFTSITNSTATNGTATNGIWSIS